MVPFWNFTRLFQYMAAIVGASVILSLGMRLFVGVWGLPYFETLAILGVVCFSPILLLIRKWQKWES